ncbi:MAG: hypothetical protein ACRC3A_00635 [Culicoidibacterales bacterium]
MKRNEDQRKFALMTRLVQLDAFGEVHNPCGYAKKVIADKQYADCDIYELFDLVTGIHHLYADGYDRQAFDLLYPAEQVC